jgi:hypothetical protein
MGDQIPNPADPDGGLKRQLENDSPLQSIPIEDPLITKAEKVEETGLHEPALKRVKLDQSQHTPTLDVRDKVKGVALVKQE